MDLKRAVSFDEFLQTDGPAEWVEGKVVPLAAVDLRHDDLSSWLVAIMRPYVEARELGSIHKEPFVMRPAADLPGRSPDVLFVATANRGRLKKTFLDGPADLAVEVVSQGSQVRDRGEKFYEYERGGVLEYWLIDPIRGQAEFYGLRDGLYQALPPTEGLFHSSALPGFWLRVEWLWQDPLPKIRTVLQELGV